MFINQRHKCKCGERWMDVWFGFIYWKEDYVLADNLMRFVNSCKCMDVKKKNNKKTK